LKVLPKIMIGVTLVAGVIAGPAPAFASSPDAPSSGSSTNLYLPRGKFTFAGAGNSTNAYPTGCVGSMILYESSNNVLTASATSACTYSVQKIWQQVTIYRSRWYGWEQVDRWTDWRNNVWSFAMDNTYNCAGTGTHTFRAEVQGQIVTHGGQIYNGGAYDQVDDLDCG
jgi:hypothetical protein